ncbi:MAG: hypothetical protein D6731_15255 [Planctomycetota bacterium]|nr:MAG: hypothetical protein D6731_15255 [Planctomycetota bacterium]
MGAAERSAALGSVELELRECFRRLPVDTVGAQAALLRARHALDELGAGAAAAPARSRAQLLGRIAGVLAAVLEADAGRPEIARLLGSLRAQCARAEGPVAAEALRELDRGLDLLKLAERVVLGERAGEERRLGAAGSDLRDLVAVLDAIDRPASLGPGTPFPPHAVRAWKRLRSTFLGRWLRQAIRGVERVGRMRSEQPELPPTVALLAAASAEVAEQGRLGAFGAARVLELRPGAEYEVLSRVPVRALAFPLPELPAAASPGLRIAVFGAGRDRFELLPGGARKGSEASRRCAGWGRLAVVERVAADRIVLYGVEVSTERWRLVASLAFEATPKNDGPVGFFWLPERTSAYPLPPVAVRDLR